MDSSFDMTTEEMSRSGETTGSGLAQAVFAATSTRAATAAVKCVALIARALPLPRTAIASRTLAGPGSGFELRPEHASDT